MQDGRVLIIGGWTGTFISCNAEPGSYQGQALSGAELYDPATESFTAVGPLNHASYGHAAALRADGTVLVVGGIDLPSRRAGTRYRTRRSIASSFISRARRCSPRPEPCAIHDTHRRPRLCRPAMS